MDRLKECVIMAQPGKAHVKGAFQGHLKSQIFKKSDAHSIGASLPL